MIPRAGKMKIILTVHISAALLLLLLLAEPPNQGAEAFPLSCCLKTRNIKIKRDVLKTYSVQDKPLCPVKALRFVTKTNIVVCLDPSSPWAINTMAFLDNRGRIQENSTANKI